MIVRVLICGSRNWFDHAPIRDAINSLPPPVTVVHGGARGADSIAAEEARRRRAIFGDEIKIEAHPANWKKHGRKAGPIRNQEMLASGINQVIAFRLPGPSRGTDDLIRRARAAGVPVRVVPGQ